jgi:hypothetical protein
MGFHTHDNRLVVFKGFKRTFRVQLFSDVAKTIPIDLTSGKAWYSVALVADIGTTRLFQYHSSDGSPLVDLFDAVNGIIDFTVPASAFTALDAPVEVAWDLAFSTSSGDPEMAVCNAPMYVDCTVNDPTLVP